ncbi:mitochondrial intermediate peptidase [Microthyrium microscopicum]|uniref:Mitochondrial intermediate peptidase n=1 Tax=Microthyrium microscopicum TaxID=703497 RepID=A0A6A6UIU5_9PEZI|nr:mitochondrial intermediate peptidase [Microthyrium microscopicum]
MRAAGNLLRALQRQQPWTCSSCRSRIARRYASTLTSTVASPTFESSLSPPAFNASRASQDDDTLRKIFDSGSFWNGFSAKELHSERSTGLIGNRYLDRPEGFLEYAQHSIRKCFMLVNQTLAMESPDEYKSIVKVLDRLSDLLCRVIDLADFIRSTHPSPQFQQAATQAYAQMFEYMNQLNTTTGLNEQLKKAASIPEVFDSWTEEERTVANILLKDFNKSAIDLSDEDRNAFVALSNQIAEVGTVFAEKAGQPKAFNIHLKAKRLNGFSPVYIREKKRFGMVSIPTTGPLINEALSTVEDPDTRREIYMATRSSADNNRRRLEDLLYYRAKLAKLAGYSNYGQMALADKMAKTPEAVRSFLHALKADTQPVVDNELDQLLEIKKADAHASNFPGRINSWDKDFYARRLMAGLATRIRSPDALSSYFSLGTVFQGLSRLFQRLYGIRLVPRETLRGETWQKDVRRLDVVDESDNIVAVLYCDLFSRQGKSQNPAHFTLRCARAISAEEIAEFTEEAHPFPNAVAAATEGLAYSVDKRASVVRQLPTIALICDFDRPVSDDRPSLLSLRDVQTLFHEMGHAIHSILGQTQLQNVSGTRCATDLAELPSVLMEYFALAPQVLALWARHYATNKPLPFALVEERLAIERKLQGLETEGQIMMALLDQELHSNKDWTSNSSIGKTTEIYHDVYSNATLPEPPGTSWEGHFGHLYGYGATYYSYLFARAVAGRIWKQVFESGERATDRAAGERFASEMLRWGGSRDGWKCIAGVLQNEKLASGDHEAMAMVGKWGVRGELEL